MGYQFIHVSCYARVAGVKKVGGHSIFSIVAEAERREGDCPHIEAPQPPILIFGCRPSEAAAQAVEWADESKDAMGRGTRKDGLCLAAGVITWPSDRPEAEWAEYRDCSVKWLQKQHGKRLLSVVEHTDEAHRHIHYYMVPQPGERFDVLHSGRAAAAAAKAAGAKKGDQNRAYIDAMRAWQADFHREVSQHHGLTRLGPRRRRLTRAEWRAEQSVAQHQACELARLERAGELVDLAQGNLEQAAHLAEVEAERHKKARRELEEIIMEVKKQDKQRAKEIHQTAQDRISAGRMSIERQKIWEKKRDEFLIPPKELSYNQAERRRELARKYDYLMYPAEVRRQAVETSRQGGEALRRIEDGQREAGKAENQWDRQVDYLRGQAAELKPWHLLEKARVSSKLREAEAALAAARAEQKSLALAEKKLIASCPVEVVARYRYSQEEEREKAIAELLRREVSEAEAERREAAEAKERHERMAMRPAPAKEKKPGGWSPPRPS